jgi:hypothetical protein
VLDREVGSATAKAVYLALAWHANDRTGQCFPSIALLARELELNRKTVSRALRKLVDAGEVARTSQRRGGAVAGYQYTFPRFEMQSSWGPSTSTGGLSVRMPWDFLPPEQERTLEPDLSTGRSLTAASALSPVAEQERVALGRAIEDALEYLEDLGCSDDATLTTLWREAERHAITAEDVDYAVEQVDRRLSRGEVIDNPCGYVVGVLKSIGGAPPASLSDPFEPDSNAAHANEMAS